MDATKWDNPNGAQCNHFTVDDTSKTPTAVWLPKTDEPWNYCLMMSKEETCALGVCMESLMDITLDGPSLRAPLRPSAALMGSAADTLGRREFRGMLAVAGRLQELHLL